MRQGYFFRRRRGGGRGDVGWVYVGFFFFIKEEVNRAATWVKNKKKVK